MGLQDRDWFKEDQDRRANCGPNPYASESSKEAWVAEAHIEPWRFSGFFVFYIGVLSFCTGFFLAYLCRHEIGLLLAIYGISL